MPTEDFEQAQYLSSQVEQARQRAVLAASDAGAARSGAAGSEQQAREYARRAQAAADASSDAPQNAAEAKAAAASAIAASGAADTAKTEAQAAAAISSTAAATAKQEAIADAEQKYGGLLDKVATKVVHKEGSRWVWGLENATHYVIPDQDGRIRIREYPFPAPNPLKPELDW